MGANKLAAVIAHNHTLNTPEQTGGKLVVWRTVVLFVLAVVLWFFFGFITGLHLVCLFFIEKFRINENLARKYAGANTNASPRTVQKEETREAQVLPYSIFDFCDHHKPTLGACIFDACLRRCGLAFVFCAAPADVVAVWARGFLLGRNLR